MTRLLGVFLALFATAAFAGLPIAGTGPNLPITPNIAGVVIVSGVAQCTASGQPWACCTGSGAGATCTITAASTDAAPTWATVYTGDAGATADCVSAGTPFACCTGAGAGSNCPTGTKITGLWLTTSDATAHVVTCAVKISSTIKTVSLAISTGTTKPGYASGVGALNLLSIVNWPGLPVDSDGNPYLVLAGSAQEIDCRFATALTSGTSIEITAEGYAF